MKKKQKFVAVSFTVAVVVLLIILTWVKYYEVKQGETESISRPEVWK